MARSLKLPQTIDKTGAAQKLAGALYNPGANQEEPTSYDDEQQRIIAILKIIQGPKAQEPAVEPEPLPADIPLNGSAVLLKALGGAVPSNPSVADSIAGFLSGRMDSAG